MVTILLTKRTHMPNKTIIAKETKKDTLITAPTLILVLALALITSYSPLLLNARLDILLSPVSSSGAALVHSYVKTKVKWCERGHAQ